MIIGGDVLSQWEYHIITKDKIEDLGIEINKEADNGWEPINISSEAPWQGVPKFHCLLRRLKEGQRIESRSKRW